MNRTRWADLAELVRAPAALSVPGDVVAGAAAAGAIGRATPGLAVSSVLLYWAGMAANDWADRELDGVERPERPIPSGRISADTALVVAVGLSAAGLAVAGLAGGRRSLAVAVPLVGSVWAYDLWAKNTAAGPAFMATCRGLDVVLGGTPGTVRRTLPAAVTVAAHTYLVTALSRREVSGADPRLPAATMAGTAAVTAAAVLSRGGGLAIRSFSWRTPSPVVNAALAVAYAIGFGVAQAQAVNRPSAGRIRSSVRAGIMGLPWLQGALAARTGAWPTGVAVALAAPVGRRLAQRLSPT